MWYRLRQIAGEIMDTLFNADSLMVRNRRISMKVAKELMLEYVTHFDHGGGDVRNFNKTDNKFSEMRGNGRHRDRANKCGLY